MSRPALRALLLPPILLSSPPTRDRPDAPDRVFASVGEEVYERLVTARERELAAAAWTERMRRWAARCERLFVLSPDAVQHVPSLLGIAPEGRWPRPPRDLS